MRTYVVKTANGYLYPFQGAISFTDDQAHAGHFLMPDEAHILAQIFGYTEERYEIIAVEMPERR
ncbi:MAG TPA: hypothetical protein DHV59_02270 [Oxalobacteraceae bacterium]|nr:hypothetical protein [Oxalobacteraceae bacterium]